MIKILIRDKNRFFQQGMECLLRDFSRSRLHQDVCFEYKFTLDTITEANIIVMDLHPGESYLCYSDLCRYRKGILLAVQERKMQSIDLLPHCFRNTTFIVRNMPVNTIRQDIIRTWENHQPDPIIKCLTCTNKCLSKQQLLLMRLMLHGQNEKEIADRLSINVKVVFSHKYQIMDKFSLKTNQELNAFIRSYLLHFR